MSDPTPFRVGVLASGTGTNLQAILDQLHGAGEIEVVAVGSDKPAAQALERGARAGHRDRDLRSAPPIRTARRATWRWPTGSTAATFSSSCWPATCSCCRRRSCAGSPTGHQRAPGAPAGVPRDSTRSRQALEHGVRITGVTIHYVDEGVDSGPIMLQQAGPGAAGPRPRGARGGDPRDRARAPAAGDPDDRGGPRRDRARNARREDPGGLDSNGEPRSGDNPGGRLPAGRDPDPRSLRADLGLRQDRDRRLRPRAARAGRPDPVHRRHRGGDPRRGPGGDRRRRVHRLARDPRRAREDAAPAAPRRPARAPRRLGPHGDARGGGNRADRPRVREPLPVRAHDRAARRDRARGGREHRHRRADDDPRRRQEPRRRRGRGEAREL